MKSKDRKSQLYYRFSVLAQVLFKIALVARAFSLHWPIDSPVISPLNSYRYSCNNKTNTFQVYTTVSNITRLQKLKTNRGNWLKHSNLFRQLAITGNPDFIGSFLRCVSLNTRKITTLVKMRTSFTKAHNFSPYEWKSEVGDHCTTFSYFVEIPNLYCLSNVKSSCYFPKDFSLH